MADNNDLLGDDFEDAEPPKQGDFRDKPLDADPGDDEPLEGGSNVEPGFVPPETTDEEE